jgi:hypothetical protein
MTTKELINQYFAQIDDTFNDADITTLSRKLDILYGKRRNEYDDEMFRRDIILRDFENYAKVIGNLSIAVRALIELESNKELFNKEIYDDLKSKYHYIIANNDPTVKLIDEKEEK